MKTEDEEMRILQLNENLWLEWSAPDDMKLIDYEAIIIMTKAFGIRLEHDKETIEAMINDGVEPDTAWDKVGNLKDWFQACLLTVYNIGRGDKAAATADVFATYINDMDLDAG